MIQEKTQNPTMGKHYYYYYFIIFFLYFSRLRDDRVKTLNFYEQTIPQYLPDNFLLFFKISAQTTEVLIGYLSNCEELMERITPGGRTPIELGKKLLMTIRYLASQETIRELSDHFGVTPSSLIRCKRQVIKAVVNNLMPKLIKWPEDRAGMAQRFWDLPGGNFPNIIGAIDGSHIPIEAPSDNPNAYYNRKKFHSIILQGVCDTDLKFTHVNIGWPGRVHDAKVLRNSELWDYGFEDCDYGHHHLIGDAAYPVKEWLLTPYRDNGHLTNRQKNYNTCLSSKRQVIERAFALLKGRFRRLKYIKMQTVEETCETVAAACTMHNFCILQGDILPNILAEDMDEPHPHMALPFRDNNARGQLKRWNITQAL